MARYPLWLVLVSFLAACGDEAAPACGADCAAGPTCGDGTCEAGEECAADCATGCDGAADGICPEACAQDPDCGTCVADCGGRECGDDGCGGVCGTCDAGESCDDGNCTAACVPDCADKACGDDGCGGVCGECGADAACVDSRCVERDPRCGAMDPEVCAALAWGSCADDWVWRTPFTELGGALLALEADDERVWLAGEYAFLAFHDGEYLYKVDNPPGTGWIEDIWRSPDGRWWAVGEGGHLFLGDGNCWADVPSPTRANLRGVWGTSDEDVWAVGGDRVVLHFDGTGWKQVAVPTEFVRGSIRDVWGSGDDVWVVGSASLVIHWDGTRWDRYLPVYEFHDFHRVFVRSPTDVWVLSSQGAWLHFDGSEWGSDLRPDLLLDLWGEGEDVWRSWAHSGSGTGGFEHSANGGESWSAVEGIYDLLYVPRRAFGDELWALRPISNGTDLVRIVDDVAQPIGDPSLRALFDVTVTARAPGGELIATNYDHLFTFRDGAWESEVLPLELQGLYFAFGATLGDDVWLANVWQTGGPSLAHRADGVWTHVPLTGLAFETNGLSCNDATCFLAVGSDGVLRLDGDAWVDDSFAYEPAVGYVASIAAAGADAWISVNRDGAGTVLRRGESAWEVVASGLAPVLSLAAGEGSAWSLARNGEIHRIDGESASLFGALPASILGFEMEWRQLRVESGRLFALSNDVVCSTSTASFDYECFASPFTRQFLRLAPGPDGVWVLAGESGHLELR